MIVIFVIGAIVVVGTAAIIVGAFFVAVIQTIIRINREVKDERGTNEKCSNKT